jgi:predicted  nucleic acid-binding Zn-ribbon protein
VELNDKLERRDRLIENLNRAQNERVFSVDKYKNELNGLRKREEGLQRTEATLRNENLVLQERIRDANNRIELALKVGSEMFVCTK